MQRPKPCPTSASTTMMRLSFLAVSALATGCGTYEPAKPGVHREVGAPPSDLSCEYGPPTAMVIKSWRCRPTENKAEEERRAKETLQSIEIPPPPPP